jgi:hypothetical protein
MSRSSTSRRRRRGDSRSTALIAQPAVGATTPVALRALPDRRRRPSDGILVEASILGRVLGLRLLKLDAVVMLVPADVAPPSSAARAERPSPGSPAGRPQPPSTSSPARPVTGRSRLAEAVRNIDEGAEILAEAQLDGTAISHNANG